MYIEIMRHEDREMVGDGRGSGPDCSACEWRILWESVIAAEIISEQC